MTNAPPRERLDKWLWKARFFRSRALAAEAVGKGLRLNGRKGVKPGAQIKTGDMLTFRQGAQVRVVEVAGFGARRGPAAEARALYHDHAPPQASAETCDEDAT